MVLLGLVNYFGGSLWTLIKWLIKSPLTIVLGVILVLLGSGQGIVQLLYGVKGLVNYVGGAGLLYNLVLFTFLLVTIVLIALSKVVAIKNIFVSAVSGIFITSGAVYLYQFVTAGTANYFSTKITFVAFMLVTVFFAAALLAVFSDYLFPAMGQVVGSLFIICLVVFIPVASNMDLGTSDQQGIGSPNYATGKRFLSEYSAGQIGQLLVNQKIDNSNFVIYKHLNYPEDVTTTHFVQMMSRKPIPLCAQHVTGDLINSWKLDPQVVIQCANGKDFYVMTATANYQEIVKKFAGHPNIKVIQSS
jgi:hypothetical protein